MRMYWFQPEAIGGNTQNAQAVSASFMFYFPLPGTTESSIMCGSELQLAMNVLLSTSAQREIWALWPATGRSTP